MYKGRIWELNFVDATDFPRQKIAKYSFFESIILLFLSSHVSFALNQSLTL